jgi:magnesium transporter
MPTDIDGRELVRDWNHLSLSERLKAFNGLPRWLTDNVFLVLPTEDQLELIEHLPQNEQRIWMRILPPDDAADLIQLVPEEERPALLAELDDPGRKEVNALLAYREDVAGGLMSPRFARVRPAGGLEALDGPYMRIGFAEMIQETSGLANDPLPWRRNGYRHCHEPLRR